MSNWEERLKFLGICVICVRDIKELHEKFEEAP